MTEEGGKCCEGGNCGSNNCGCSHHKVVPGLVVLLGLLFLGGTLGWVSSYTVDVGWPIIVILAGLMKIRSNRCKCC